MGRAVRDYIAQLTERINLQVFAGLHQRTQNGGAMDGGFTSWEQPVLRPSTLGRSACSAPLFSILSRRPAV